MWKMLICSSQFLSALIKNYKWITTQSASTHVTHLYDDTTEDENLLNVSLDHRRFHIGLVDSRAAAGRLSCAEVTGEDTNRGRHSSIWGSCVTAVQKDICQSCMPQGVCGYRFLLTHGGQSKVLVTFDQHGGWWGLKKAWDKDETE